MLFDQRFPNNPATLYAGTDGGGVFKSTDSGANWAAATTGLTNLVVQALAINPITPATLYAGTDGGGVFKSADSGASWTLMNTGLTYTNVFSLALDPNTPANLYAGTGGGVFEFSVVLPSSSPLPPMVAATGVNGLFFTTGSSLLLTGAVTPGPLAGTPVDAFITITLPTGDTFYLQPDGTWSLTIAPVVTNWPMAPISGTILGYTFQGTEPPGLYVLRIFFRQPGATTPVGREARSFFIFLLQ